MLGLPKNTELKKQIPKNAIYSKFNLSTYAKDKFDTDIKRIVVVNEVSEATTTITKGEKVKNFFVLLVVLKKENFDEKNIALISKLINQNLLFILQYEDKSKLAIYHTKLLQTNWQKSEDLSIELKGLNFDMVWDNIIIQVGRLKLEEGNSIDKQIALDEKRQKLRKQIERLEKQAWAENQPKKKFDLVQEINKLKKELEDISYGQA